MVQCVMVEIKFDCIVFNVQGIINSMGFDGFLLLCKVFGVIVDNNDNINVFGCLGVFVYVDGKCLLFGGQDFSNFL